MYPGVYVCCGERGETWNCSWLRTFVVKTRYHDDLNWKEDHGRSVDQKGTGSIGRSWEWVDAEKQGELMQRQMACLKAITTSKVLFLYIKCIFIPLFHLHGFKTPNFFWSRRGTEFSYKRMKKLGLGMLLAYSLFQKTGFWSKKSINRTHWLLTHHCILQLE